MVRLCFTEEQIADFLQQSKNGVPNKALCEEYGFSNSTLRRWQEKHAESVRQELKQIESTAKIVFLCFIAAAILLTLMFPKPTAALAIPPYLVYCISYIRRFRRISAKHIRRWDISSSRSGSGAENVFYKLSWTFLFFMPAYSILQLLE
ncbi:transposase [Salmonella enterica subsp. enterica serovar Java]|uniref:Transposase n=4 Tax=Salmonella enterica TaxID=28901 RepID=A0A3Z3GAX2_SALEB|nr:transposase [Salmonella enterica]ECA3885687.1 transposase [Salmonella enterica subsp. enterica serovar Infantis]EDH8285911.1 transposase [Salmonella enterica subsp. enterica serovar Livingstone]HBB8737984.1 transposase [Salmonella enterica subsp. enterica serovar Paratyphi A]HBZ1822256.1 transposase [Salmonella enterica subsp. enterica serovar Paratyphi B var. L-tartrate +]ASQ28176.1 transposase [Salmonella enterica subsp. enterica]